MARATNHPRRWWRVLAVVVAIPVVLVLALWLLVPREKLVRFVLDRALPAASQTLGREVTVERADVDLLPMPQVALSGLKIAGAPGEPDFLRVGNAKVRVSIWPLLRSRGQEVEVRSVALDRPDVTLVRRPDGTWSHDEILARLGKPPPGQKKRNIELDSVTLDRGRITVVDRQSSGERSVALDQLGLRLSNVTPGENLKAELDAALASKSRNLHASLEVKPLPTGPVTPQNAPELTGTISLDSLALAKLEPLFGPSLRGVINGGNAKLSMSVKTQKQGTYALDGNVALDQVQLHGQPASGGAEVHGAVDLARPLSSRLSVEKLALKGPGVDAAGEVRVQLPKTVRFSLAGRELDLETLLGVLPKSPKSQEKTRAPPGALARLDVQGNVRFDDVRSGKLRASNLDAAVTLDKGVLVVTRGRAEVFGGDVSLDGTRVDLAQAEPAWRLKAEIQHLALADAQQALSGASLMSGAMDLSLDVAGTGKDWARLRTNLDGGGKLALRDGSLGSLDLTKSVALPLAQAFARAGQPGAASKIPGQGATRLQDLGGSFSIRNGWLVFDRPLGIDTPAGKLALKGKIGLDKRLSLSGTLATAPDLIAQVSNGLLAPTSPLPLPVVIDGSLESPHLAFQDTGAVTQKLMESQGRRMMRGAEQRALDELQKRLQH